MLVPVVRRVAPAMAAPAVPHWAAVRYFATEYSLVAPLMFEAVVVDVARSRNQWQRAKLPSSTTVAATTTPALSMVWTHVPITQITAAHLVVSVVSVVKTFQVIEAVME